MQHDLLDIRVYKNKIRDKCKKCWALLVEIKTKEGAVIMRETQFKFRGAEVSKNRPYATLQATLEPFFLISLIPTGT